MLLHLLSLPHSGGRPERRSVFFRALSPAWACVPLPAPSHRLCRMPFLLLRRALPPDAGYDGTIFF